MLAPSTPPSPLAVRATVSPRSSTHVATPLPVCHTHAPAQVAPLPVPRCPLTTPPMSSCPLTTSPTPPTCALSSPLPARAAIPPHDSTRRAGSRGGTAAQAEGQGVAKEVGEVVRGHCYRRGHEGEQWCKRAHKGAQARAWVRQTGRGRSTGARQHKRRHGCNRQRGDATVMAGEQGGTIAKARGGERGGLGCG